MMTKEEEVENNSDPDILIVFWDGHKMTKTVRASGSETGFILIGVREMIVDMHYGVPKTIKQEGKKEAEI